MPGESIGPTGGSGASSLGAREEILSILRTQYDEEISRFFGVVFNPTQFRFTLESPGEGDVRFFTIETITSKPETLKLRTEVLSLVIKLGLIVPPKLEGALQEVKKKAKSIKEFGSI